MTKLNFPPHVVAILAVLIIITFMVSAYLFGRRDYYRAIEDKDAEIERHKQDKKDLAKKVTHALNECADLRVMLNG
jgi:peptidoglycan hydrolase CwlO-like protein